MRAGIGFLAVNIPITQVFQRNWLAGNRAAHETAGAPDTVFPIAKFNICLCRRNWPSFKSVHWASIILEVWEGQRIHSKSAG